MQWRHRSVRIALRGINKKGVEIGERQNRCHDDSIHGRSIYVKYSSDGRINFEMQPCYLREYADEILILTRIFLSRKKLKPVAINTIRRNPRYEGRHTCYLCCACVRARVCVCTYSVTTSITKQLIQQCKYIWHCHLMNRVVFINITNR